MSWQPLEASWSDSHKLHIKHCGTLLNKTGIAIFPFVMLVRPSNSNYGGGVGLGIVQLRISNKLQVGQCAILCSELSASIMDVEI